MAPCAEGNYKRQRPSLMSLTSMCVQRHPGGTRAALMQENMLEGNILYMRFIFLNVRIIAVTYDITQVLCASLKERVVQNSVDQWFPPIIGLFSVNKLILLK